jgi:hypothetical protein
MAPAAMQDSPPSVLVHRLGAEEWMLVRLREQLYGGRWDEMRTDLECRRRGQPYIFKLVHRIEEDLERIARLEAMEAELGIILGDHLPDVDG